MVYNTQRYWVFGLCPSSGFEITKNTTFQKLDLFPSSITGPSDSRVSPTQHPAIEEGCKSLPEIAFFRGSTDCRNGDVYISER
jgi:hypothetical protein